MRRRSVMFTLLTLLAATLSGCIADTDADDADDAPPQPLASHDVRGRVLTPAFNPIEGARVWIGQSGMCTTDGVCTADLRIIETTTDAQGAFMLDGIWPGNTTLHAEHPEFRDANSSARVPGPGVNITLAPIDRIVPFQQQFPFKGFIECAAEYLIISPSCDTLVTYAGGPPMFQTDSTFAFAAEDAWATIVVDTSFDPAEHPGIAGLRLSAYADNGSTDLGEYERFAQAVGEGPFTLRLEPGADFGDNVPVPLAAGGFRMEYFPHGHADDTVCDPTSGTCFLGVGVAMRIEFEAVATVFYHEAAPDGWTLLDD